MTEPWGALGLVLILFSYASLLRSCWRLYCTVRDQRARQRRLAVVKAMYAAQIKQQLAALRAAPEAEG